MRKVRRQYLLSATEQALYYELISICNETGWPIAFSCTNAELCSVLSISENHLLKCRKALETSGLIDYKSGQNKRQAGTYSFNIDALTTSPDAVATSPDAVATSPDVVATSPDVAKSTSFIQLTTAPRADCNKQKKNKQLHAKSAAIIFLSKEYEYVLKKMFEQKTSWPEKKNKSQRRGTS